MTQQRILSNACLWVEYFLPFSLHRIASHCIDHSLQPPEKDKLWEFSAESPPRTLTRQSVESAVAQLSANDPKLARIITRVGVDAIFLQAA